MYAALHRKMTFDPYRDATGCDYPEMSTLEWAKPYKRFTCNDTDNAFKTTKIPSKMRKNVLTEPQNLVHILLDNIRNPATKEQGGIKSNFVQSLHLNALASMNL